MARRQKKGLATPRSFACRALAFLAVVLMFSPIGAAQGAKLGEMSLERWAKLREAERYQLNIAEKYWRDKKYDVAMSEYEKFLTLYERSEGASYAQLKWSMCLVQLRKLNTAIKDGYQTVIDYWPDSPEAVEAAYRIGAAYKDMGEMRPAKKAYAEVITKYPEDSIAALARFDLVDIAGIEGDTATKLKLLRELTFDTQRTRETENECARASRDLASLYFTQGAFDQGKESLATTYNETQLPAQVLNYCSSPLRNMVALDADRAKGHKMADQIVSFLRESMPEDLTDETQEKHAKDLWYSMATVESWAGRPDKVPPLYEQMVKVFGVDDDILGHLAGWQQSQGDYVQARATYGRFKDAIAGQDKIAGTWIAEKKFDQAVSIYQRLAGEDADNAPQWLMKVASTYREAKKLNEAVGVYQQLISEDPTNAPKYQWLIAYTYEEFNKFAEAIKVYQTCGDRYPENYQRMAHCHRQVKQQKQALILYHALLAEDNLAPWAQLQIGYTYREDGQKEKAILAFQRVCEKFPTTSYASQSHAFLQNEYKINVTLGGAKNQK